MAIEKSIADDFNAYKISVIDATEQAISINTNRASCPANGLNYFEQKGTAMFGEYEIKNNTSLALQLVA